MFKLLVLFAVLGLVYPKEFIFVNNHGSTVWIGSLGNSGMAAPNNGGFALGAGEQIQPVNLGVDPNNQYGCGVSGCTNNLNPGCPEGLKVYNGAGQVVACKSSCLAYNTDQYCCRGDFGTPQTCNINSWPVNSASYFKANCPGAYSYAYDDTTSTYTCTDSAYRITICWKTRGEEEENRGFNFLMSSYAIDDDPRLWSKRDNNMFRLVVLLAVLGVVYPKDFIFVNNRGSTVWIGTLGNSGKPAPNNGGFQLDAGQQITVTTDDSWAGRFWPRTGCSFDGNGNGHCETGDCGNKLQCAGAGGQPPATLAEFTLNGDQGQDFYDIQPVNNAHGGGDRRCGVAGCSKNLNPGCPNELRVNNGCKSSCYAFNTDQYCCRGQYGTVETCDTSRWPVNSASYFKSNCPDAYSYAYDDRTSTFTCDDRAYRITIS
ncbi:hypothetical protein C0J52_18971 [Blattella germanica]|nr:hypothetical protein C0J52_18971 [Blattella germanica]